MVRLGLRERRATLSQGGVVVVVDVVGGALVCDPRAAFDARVKQIWNVYRKKENGSAHTTAVVLGFLPFSAEFPLMERGTRFLVESCCVGGKPILI